jgi:hypothetical protein
LPARHRRLGAPFDRRLRRGLQPERDGLIVVHDQRWQNRAGGELVPAVHAALRLHRIADLAQPLDVTPQRPDRDVEPLRQLDPRTIPR